ncbi:hypothetical protein SAMD00019534_011290 [Acytostelium subglobosum LB1]|uniref:hypothetical protein n=1 Tax=Acytostelium subglobosum LB1 TaxID=1410327 RepID=UPI000644D027|nr:hypothetical protein SAMD00019534_011290 [Acytostelium subglobosum LB1]GAM17954.1 hypothetical protein SAMD00019534_011290 [Acytostelium subglobosum LB1]|eukprot:XP_012758550.1 hypothetical protein SAMD00019534_011290 [Acytostelium subglobosum LB1]
MNSQSTQNKRRLISWNPHITNTFIVGSNDIRLYELKHRQSGSGGNSLSKVNMPLSFDIEYPPDDWTPQDKKSIDLLSVNNDVQYLKCMAWSPDPADPNLIACGLVNGKTILTSFSSVKRNIKEFVPKHIRPCNTIAWNPINKTHLAIGLDKVRGDSSTLVWDINYLNRAATHSSSGHIVVDAPHEVSQLSENSFNTMNTEPVETIYQSIAEFTISEATMSLAWIPNNPFCLIIGTGAKWLRIFDIRDPNTTQSVPAHQKSVNGISIDPFDNNRMATMSEDSIVKIWDMRKFDDPVMTINTNYKSVQQIEWCPTRSGILATSGRDKNSIKLYDVKAPVEQARSPRPDRKSTSDQNLMYSFKPTKTLHVQDISSFSWHPKNECRMLTVSHQGVVEVINVNENIPLAWSPAGDLCFSFGMHLIEGPTKGNTIEPNLAEERFANLTNDGRYNRDISLLMKERAKTGYSANIDDNVKISSKFNEKDIFYLWGWIQRIPQLLQQFQKKIIVKPAEQLQLQQQQQQQQQTEATQPKDNEYIGIYKILHDQKTFASQTIEQVQIGFNTYLSSQRALCSLICGWGFSTSNPIESTLTMLERSGDFEKAAAMAVFHLEIKRAVQIIHNGCMVLATQGTLAAKDRETSLRLMSFALAGLGDGPGAKVNSFWKETCRQTAKSFSNPYLKLCLDFLSINEQRELSNILEESSVTLATKVAFACRYLDSQDLVSFVDKMTLQVAEQGNLHGIILTGLSVRGIDLLQQYIDRTSDIQTACLVASLVVPKHFHDKRVPRWISLYSELLDTWECWHERATFDIHRISWSEPPTSQIFAKCGYCQMSFSFESVSNGSMAGRNPRVNTRSKVPCCPHCKQPLPRCCLCLLPMSCMVPGIDYKKPSNREFWTAGAEPFDDWFTWCQTCRHGGHARHISDWFKDHQQCPVTDCTCKCSSI